MSYILDALRRAESERERGTVPKLHANPAPADLADDEAAGPRLHAWVWLAAVLGLMLIGALASQWLSRDGGAPTAQPVAQSVAQTPSPAPAIAAPPLATGPQSGAEVVRLQPPQSLPLEDPPAPPPSRAAVPSGSTVAAASAPRLDPAAAQRVPTLSELPAEIRREVPALVTGGAMYSDTPANRILLINGQVFHEGDKVAPNLVLEQIKLNTAVLSFKGHRYGISY